MSEAATVERRRVEIAVERARLLAALAERMIQAVPSQANVVCLRGEGLDGGALARGSSGTGFSCARAPRSATMTRSASRSATRSPPTASCERSTRRWRLSWPARHSQSLAGQRRGRRGQRGRADGLGPRIMRAVAGTHGRVRTTARL
jgi:hypothetical protein